MCEVPKAVCSVSPRKVPGSCENRVSNRHGVTFSGATVSYALGGGRKERGWPSLKELLKFAAEYLPDLNGEIPLLLHSDWKCPSNQLYPALPYVQNEGFKKLCFLSSGCSQLNVQMLQDKNEYHVLSRQWSSFLRGFIPWFNYGMTKVSLCSS